MADLSQIKEHAEVIGADGVHVGTVDGVEDNRIKLTKSDSGQAAMKAIIIILMADWWPRSTITLSGYRPMATLR